MAGYSWRHGVTALLGLYASSSSTTAHGQGVSPVQGKPGDLVFSPCPANSSIPGAECGYAIVPLDYTNPDAGVAKIALGRYNATSSTRKGSVLFNPGGPGGEGVGLATQAGAGLQQIIGEEYDIIGFDPRGIGQTEPATQCFPTPEARDAFIANTVLDRGYDVSPNVTDPFNRYHLIQLQRDAEALYKTQFAICGQNMGDQLRYMGTTTVVRDIDYITTLLDGKDALINFYGLSYGTVIGQYLVNMLPDRVGRVVIDGVVDANAWANVPPYKWYRTWLDATDSVYQLFFDDCAKAGPSACALAKANETGEDIFNRVEAFVANLYDQPMPAPNATNPGVLTNGRARLFLLSILEVPNSWPTMASWLASALAGDPTFVMNAVSPGQFPDLERSGVSCNDQMPFTAPTPEETIDEAIDVYKTVTRFNFAVTVAEADSGCQYWPVTPPERYSGPWNATTKNPVLIVSNTHDPVTPLTNGKLVQSMLISSALLVQDGPGHTSFALASTCTILNTRAFFANGTLPAEGTVCPIDGGPFPGPAAAKGTVVAAAENVETLPAAHGDYAEAVRHIASFVLGSRH
ncbi:TAP-like protein-domain-containing protein [Daedaleopsis nitida]|nr:TAP-like protein-domain-containing protein [Daedaleopsis nitida]